MIVIKEWKDAESLSCVKTENIGKQFPETHSFAHQRNLLFSVKQLQPKRYEKIGSNFHNGYYSYESGMCDGREFVVFMHLKVSAKVSAINTQATVSNNLISKHSGNKH